jgi:hypothetical protein
MKNRPSAAVAWHRPDRCVAARLAFAAALPPLAVALAWPLAARAQDRADLERTQIIGNRELPKVLYIVPWKKPLHGNMGGRAVTGVVEEALAPIDRDVLRRQVSFDAQIRAAVAAPVVAAGTAPRPAAGTGASPAAAGPASPARNSTMPPIPIASPVPLAPATGPARAP